MSYITYKEYYCKVRKILEMNVLPEKYCNFDCIFCPLGRKGHITDGQIKFPGLKAELLNLEKAIDTSLPDLVFINSKGEAFVNEDLSAYIDLIKRKGGKVKLLTNGYMLGEDKYSAIANMCDEVLGEVKTVEEQDFQKIQRPMEGYTLEKHLSSMESFVKQYKGKFILEITLIKGRNDDDKSVEKLENIIKRIAPDEIEVVRFEDEIFSKKLGVSDEDYERISSRLVALHKARK